MEPEPDPSTAASAPSAPSTPLTPAAKPVLDEDRYREEVLLSPSAEAEQAQAQQLYDEAQQLGLKVPEIDAAGPLAASIAAGVEDNSSPVLSSGSSTDRNSGLEDTTQIVAPGSPSQYDQVVSSVSQITLAFGAKPGSTRSIASASTRPTSYYSIDSHMTPGGPGYEDALRQRGNRNSLLSVSSADRKEKRRSSFRSALGRIHFSKRRPPSTPILPPDAQVIYARGQEGDEHGYAESEQRPPTGHADDLEETRTPESLSKLEVPIFDKEALQRSLDDPQLNEMLERHQMERSRHLAFQETALSILQRRHQTAVTDRQFLNAREEDEKREKVGLSNSKKKKRSIHNYGSNLLKQNLDDTAKIEERQLAVEMEQDRDFERAKLNSRTRIKHMEGYFRNSSPPPSPAGTSTREHSSESFSSETTDGAEPTRRFTRQQREQLEQQYHDHEAMDALHEARIKVLRDRQEKRLHEAVARMERELDQLIKQNIKNLEDMQNEQRAEEDALLNALDAKKTELRHRWYLEEAILRRKLENQNGQPYGPLPPLSFDGNTDTRDSAICLKEGETPDKTRNKVFGT